MPITPIPITAFTLTNALGIGVEASLNALQTGRSGLRPSDLPGVGLETWIGRVDAIEEVELPDQLRAYDCRNNRLAYHAIQQDGLPEAIDQALSRFGAERIGVFLGTSTSGIASTEQAYISQGPEPSELASGLDMAKTHNIFSAVDLTRRLFGLAGPALSISTACSSSAKVFAAAQRYIAAGLCDAALVGGVDSLCLTTLYGFNSLDLVSSEPCRPWDEERRGISIGEAAGFALLERQSDAPSACRLLGYGESSDAYHMSAPHPQGAGAALAMQQALDRAGITTREVDYINLHGTATPSNDAAEDQAVTSLFDSPVSCSSTKGFTGHTLGAAGICEAVFSLLALQHGFLPQTLNCRKADEKLQLPVLLEPEQRSINRVLSNSFGFGGNNCSLLFGTSA